MRKNIKMLAVVTLVVVMAIALVACEYKNLDTTYNQEKRTKMENFTHLNESAQHGQAVMIGDSIVELYNVQEQFAGMEKIVYNRGISGDTSDRMLERISNALDIEPTTLFVLVGTNDIGRGIPREDTLTNVRNVILKAKESGVENIVIESVYPVNHHLNKRMVGGRQNSDIIEYNKRLKALTEELSVIYVDLFSVLKGEDGEFKRELTYDGLHPNEHGYDVITSVLKGYIR